MAAREIVSGVIGGAIGAGLMRLRAPPPAINSGKTVIAKASVNAGATVTLLAPTTYKFVIVLFHGDGDSGVTVRVTIDTTVYELAGNEQAIELVANQTLKIEAVNPGTAVAYHPSVEILWISWS